MVFLNFNDREKEIATALIHNVNYDQYLTNDLLKEISVEKNIHHFALLKIIKKLKKTSLGGLFAFNLQDKLKTFLENAGKYNEEYKILLQNIDLVFSNDWSNLSKKCGLEDSKLSNMLSETLKMLVHSDYSIEDRFALGVDLMILEKSNNELEITANEVNVPKVQIDNALYAKSLCHCRSKSDKKYIKEKASSANLLIKSLNYRSRTLLKVAKEIIYRQRDFFVGNNPYLAPINIESIANTLFLHGSTVHRAVSNKTISTPCGIFELKSLLPKKIKSNFDTVSDHSIKEYMKKLINNEPKNSPYSDDNIVHLLNTRGVKISRRTISKYRAILNIPSSIVRSKAYRIVNS
jgi:RNA polymerase sigma-54 factor